jgi:ATP-binding cassette subfamily B protein
MSENTDRPKSRSLKPLRALAPFLRPYRGTLVFALAALLAAATALLVLPVATRHLLDQGMSSHDARTINLYFALFMGAAAVYGAFAAWRFYLVTWLGERVVADVRDAVYRRVIRMDPTFFEVTRTGEVLSRLTTDTTLVQSISGVSLSITLRSAINVVGGLGLMFWTSAWLSLQMILLIPLVVLPLIAVGRRVRTLSRAAQDRIADSSGIAGETLNAIQTVQAFTLEELQSAKYAAAVERSFETAVQRARVRSWLTAIGTATVFGAITFVLWRGFHQVLTGELTGGKLTQFIIYSVIVATGGAALVEMWGEIQRAAGAMERLADLLEARPAIVAPPDPAPLPKRSQGELRFDRVAFRYPSRPEQRALEDLSFEVRAGETVAFVGPSGAGKSTTFQLLLRFYDPESGRVLVDGVDIARVRPSDLRAQIGLVPQETVLFGASARENIRYGRPDASDAEIEAAARAAAADAFIRELPQGYETFLGERGTRLSGGQRQRLAIARAILKDPPILLLDEATSSLDAESERLVQGALEELMQGRTTIVIAHRLATVLKADRIFVFDHGRVVGIGTHGELLASNALYARLARLQFGSATESAEGILA